jgi:O-antigen/teichoic acid export membrane protein
MSVLLAGGGGSQLIQLAAMPLLLRLYDPAPFGIYAICIWIAALLTVLQTFRLEIVIPVSVRLTLAARTLGAIRIVSLALFGLQTAIIVLYCALSHSTQRSGIENDVVILMIVPCLALAQSWFLSYRMLLMRRARYRTVSAGLLIRAVVFVSASVLFAIARPLLPPLENWGLLLAQFLAEATAFTFYALTLPRRLRRIASIVRIKRIRATLISNKHLFGAISIAQIVSTLNQSLPVWIAGSLYGAEAAGWLSLAQRLILAPVQLVSNSAGGLVSLQIAALHRAGKGIYPYLRGVMVKAAAASAPVFLIIAILGPLVAGPLFGERWHSAGTSIAVMSLVGFSALIYGSIEGTPILFKMGRFFLVWHLVRLVVILSAFLAASAFGMSYVQWFPIYACGEFVLYGAFCAVSLMAAKSTRSADNAPP